MLRIDGKMLSRACHTRYASTVSSCDSYQFMQQSMLPTFHFQRSLPRLPIPPLERTCSRFLAAAQPVLSPDEHAQAVKAAAHFRDGIGAELHTQLQHEDKTNKHTSYISAPWFDMYLRDRAPLPLNCNPLLVFNSEATRPAYQTQILRAANLVVSSLRFWLSLRAGLLEPEVYHLDARKSDTEKFRRWMRLMPQAFATYAAYTFKAFPLDMSQYERLFGTSRIPQEGKDLLVQHPDSRHILVLRRGHMYALDVLDTHAQLLPATELLARLKGVLELDATRAPAVHPLGVLTAMKRNIWAEARVRLLQHSARNRQLLEQQVDSALFCLALDSSKDPVYNAAQPEPLLKHLLASDGHNRWFDKSVSLLISADGNAAVNFEHSWGDGVAVLRYFNEVYKETNEKPFLHPDSLHSIQANTNAVRQLDFDLNNEELQAVIKSSQRHNAKTMQTLNMHMLRTDALSKQRCKAARVSPDAMMQLGFQLAYKRTYNDYVGTYESCSTAAFRHGRTEAIRPCTVATKEFCDAAMRLKGQQSSEINRREMLERCSTQHGQLTKDAAMGQGFDRHLFALRELGNRRGIPQHSLYETVAYKKLNYNIISTSTLASKALMAGAFGPVVHDGLGVGYSILDDVCGAIVTSYEGQRDGKGFIDQLEGAYEEIGKVMQEKKGSSK